MTAGSSIVAMSCIRPAQRGQRSTSRSKADVSLDTALDGGLTRTTTVPGSMASRLSGPLNINAASLLGLTDDQKAAFLKELRRVDADRSLKIFARDPDT
jgi:hypothetical protein